MLSCNHCGKRPVEVGATCTDCGSASAPPFVARPSAQHRPATAADSPPESAASSSAECSTGYLHNGQRRTLFLAGLGILTALLLLLNGLLVVLTVPDPVGLLLSVLGALVPAAFYTALVLSVDSYEHEPWMTVTAAFGWGALVAVLFSGVFNAAQALLLGDAFAVFMGAPLVEESLKGIALLGLLLMYRREFDNVLDGLVYGALIGMGFELTEDMLYLGSAYVEGGLTLFGEEWLTRPVLAGTAHALFTATTGAAVGWGRARHGRGVLRFVVPVLGWALAVLQHLAWNIGGSLLAASMGEGVPSVWRLALQAALLLTPAFVTLYVISRVARRREHRVICEQLADEVETGVLTEDEYHLLTDERGWQRTLRAARRDGGRRRLRMQQQFFQAAAELAFRKHHLSQGEALKDGQKCSEDYHRAQLAAARSQLAATPHPSSRQE
ncbi:MAG: PrsW family intramembrane metalloprotease [Chloroflexota bacterium]|nr:PrsW family intramembrane metalloprotease [Chloroflexota bacterium]